MANLERVRKELPSSRHEKIAARASILIAEEIAMQELRQTRKIEQGRLAKPPGIRQDAVYKLDKQAKE